ncbi:aminotransferase [Albimonas pacifica]|uniref:4-aminobutyrate---pyruvate transaminase n=1 Tax=Albimonas pacifica TaxID=1114924 RepID=A0A1I3BV02_9RHOB|nr:aminotransferase [Albimonas pacifica]SFH66134.1 4-aminobutyrate---pyruvate transaminase [Albimonas pacifica]
MLPNSNRARDLATIVHQQTELSGMRETGATLMTGGDGVYVFDEDGKRYLEGMAGMWSASLGFSEKRLAEAAYAQMQDLPYYHTFHSRGHLAAVDLAEKLLAMAPAGRPGNPLSKVLFHCSGSECNDTAIKLAWYVNNLRGRPEKKKIIGRQMGYHGCTIAAASLTGMPGMHREFDLPISDRFLHTSFPHWYRFHEEGESEEDFATRMAEDLETLILAEGPETVAAFFAEPVQGGGGALTPPRTYFEKIQAVLRKYDVLFIADEVICGFGRTGNPWGSDTYAIRPDMVSCGKALSASYQPISALMISEEIHQALLEQSARLGNFSMGFTFAAHPVACAVARRTLEIYEEDRVFEHAAEVSPAFLGALEGLMDHPLVGDVRGVGLIAGVELMADRARRVQFAPEAKVGTRVQERAMANGLLVRASGDRICFTPPLIITPSQVEEMAGLFRRTLDQTLDALTAEGLAPAA